MTLRLGDVILLQGNPQTLPAVLREFGALPLAERPILLGSVRRGIVPVLILLAAMGSHRGRHPAGPDRLLRRRGADGPVQGHSRARGLSAVDGPILVMLATLIPVSDSLRRTGATDVISDVARRSRIGAAAGRRAGA